MGATSAEVCVRNVYSKASSFFLPPLFSALLDELHGVVGSAPVGGVLMARDLRTFQVLVRNLFRKKYGKAV